jgi:hypothetical protein
LGKHLCWPSYLLFVDEYLFENIQSGVSTLNTRVAIQFVEIPEKKTELENQFDELSNTPSPGMKTWTGGLPKKYSRPWFDTGLALKFKVDTIGRLLFKGNLMLS